MSLLTVSEFLNSGLAKVIFGVLCAAFLYLMYKVATRSTAPKGNQPNTGESWKPGPQQPIPDNRPKPPTPSPKDEV